MIEVFGKTFINEKEVSSQFGLSRGWIQKNRYSENHIPYFRLNGRVLYCMDEIEQWLKLNLTHH